MSIVIQLYRELFLHLWGWFGFFGAIVGISAIVSAICFPVYTVVAKIVGRENRLQAAIHPQLAALKARGLAAADFQAAVERLYARYSYHPVMAVRKVLPLFVSIPFLFLTYYMLQGTAELDGVAWLCFADVGKPDGLLRGVNLLPFVMTGCNILTVYATPCFTRKDEAQAWFIALFFLVVLYHANTALMLYWCLNQFFNLCRSVYVDRWAGGRQLVRTLAHAFSPATAGGLLAGFGRLLAAKKELAALVVFSVAALAFARDLLDMSTILLQGTAGPIARGGRRLFQNLLIATAFWHLAAIFVTACNRARPRGLVAKEAGAALGTSAAFGALLACSYLKMAPNGVLYTAGLVVLALTVAWLRRALRGQGLPAAADRRAPVLELVALGAFALGFAAHYVGVNSETLFTAQLPILFGHLLVAAATFALLHWAVFGGLLPPRDIFLDVVAAVLLFLAVPLLDRGTLLTTKYVFVFWLPALLLATTVLRPAYLRARVPCFLFFVLLSAYLLFDGYWTTLHPVDADFARADPAAADLSASPYAGATLARTNNVYLLFFDAYPSETYCELSGVEGHIGPELAARGFTCYAGSFAAERRTVVSMAPFFSPVGPEAGSPNEILAGNNSSLDFLRAHGYETHAFLGAYLVTRLGSNLSRMRGHVFVPPAQNPPPLAHVLYRGIKSGSVVVDAAAFEEEEGQPAVVAGALAELARTGRTNPVLVYSHIDTPAHYPSRGTVLRKGPRKVHAEWREKFALANERIRAYLDAIPDLDDSIVVVASDHGPYALALGRSEFDVGSPLAVLGTYGNLLAIHWPDGYRPVLQDIHILQNAMLEIMIHLTGDASLARFRRTGLIEFPDFLTEDGVIHQGEYAGWDLFDAARDEAAKIDYVHLVN